MDLSSEIEEKCTQKSIFLICFAQKHLHQLWSIWQNVNITVFWIIQMNPSTLLSTSPFYYTFHYKNTIDLSLSIQFPPRFLLLLLCYKQLTWSEQYPNKTSTSTNINLILSSFPLTFPLLSPFPSPPHSLSLINTKQSFHILRWREKTTRKVTSVPEKSQRNGVKVRVGQRSWWEKESRKEGGWEWKNERARGKEKMEAGVFEKNKTYSMNCIRCSVQRGQKKEM